MQLRDESFFLQIEVLEQSQVYSAEVMHFAKARFRKIPAANECPQLLKISEYPIKQCEQNLCAALFGQDVPENYMVIDLE